MSESPEQIQQDIDRSREEAAQKIDQIGSQLRDATVQARDVVRQDMPDMIKEGLDVTKAELKEDLTKVGAGSAAIAGGTVLGAMGGFFLLQSVMELLAQRLTRWQAAGIMGLGLTGTAVALGFGGKEQLKPDQLKPKQTMSVLQQTSGWAKAQTQSLRSKVTANHSVPSMPEATEPRA
jgi:hypothetical protein